MAITPNVVKTDFPFVVFSHEADIDYLLARHTHFLGAGFHARAGFFAQMACEKYMKALTIQNNGTYVDNVHKLLYLASLCEPYDSYFGDSETRRLLEQFDMFDQVGRYGGAAKFDPLSKGVSVGGNTVTVSPGVQIVGMMIWSAKHLDDLDGFVFKTRSLLDFSKVSFVDSLKEIQAKSRKAMLLAEWNGRPPLRVVLTKSNRYFRP